MIKKAFANISGKQKFYPAKRFYDKKELLDQVFIELFIHMSQKKLSQLIEIWCTCSTRNKIKINQFINILFQMQSDGVIEIKNTDDLVLATSLHFNKIDNKNRIQE